MIGKIVLTDVARDILADFCEEKNARGVYAVLSLLSPQVGLEFPPCEDGEPVPGWERLKREIEREQGRFAARMEERRGRVTRGVYRKKED